MNTKDKLDELEAAYKTAYIYAENSQDKAVSARNAARSACTGVYEAAALDARDAYDHARADLKRCWDEYYKAKLAHDGVYGD